MKTNVSQQSINAIHQHRADGKSTTQRQAILKLLKRSQHPLTRGEISKITGFDKSTVAGRVFGLIRDDHVVKTGKRKCTVSNIECATVTTKEQALSVPGLMQ